MLKLAVIGKDVSQSRSPAMHTFLLERMGAQCSYEAVSFPPAQFASRAPALFGRYDGFNVTIPFKADIIPLLSRIEGNAKVFGAVNTVVAATRTGYNTDGAGFMLMLENAGVEVAGRRVLVLGAGGAGRSCIFRLAQAGAQVFAYEREEGRLRRTAEALGCFIPLTCAEGRFDVVINCTGVGMHDTVGQTPRVRTSAGEMPVGEELLSGCSAAVDLIYEPAQSEFLRIAASLGKKTVNGDAMLFYQAYYADCIYLERTPSAEEARRYYTEYSGGNT